MGEDFKHKDSLDSEESATTVVKDLGVEDALLMQDDALMTSARPQTRRLLSPTTLSPTTTGGLPRPASGGLGRPPSGGLKPLGAESSSLSSALSSMLHSAEDVLAASHGRALALAAEHADALRQAQDEATRLRRENHYMRTNLAQRTEAQVAPISDDIVDIVDVKPHHSQGTNGSSLREIAVCDAPLLNWKASNLQFSSQPAAPIEDCPVLPGNIYSEAHSDDSSVVEHIPIPSVQAISRSIRTAAENASQLGAHASAARLIIDSFEVLPDWQIDPNSRLATAAAQMVKRQKTLARGRSGVSGLLSSMSGSAGLNKQYMMEYELGLVRVGGERWWIMHPLSGLRASLDTLSLIMVLYDLIFIPLSFFELERVSFMVFMEWLVRLFWTVDMIVSFFKGLVLSDGTLEMRPAFIAKRYLKSWFIFDLGVNAIDWVAIDWMELLTSGDGGGNASLTRSMRSFRGVRALRLVRLLRLLRLKEVIEMLGERISSHWIQLIFSISKNVIAIIAIAHVLACCWYGVATGTGDRNWVNEYKFDTATFGEVYSMALLWALSQFAGGTDEITAVNLPERVYNIATFILAFVMGASFIGNLTSSMTQLHILGSANTKDLSVLRQYLCQNKVSQMLMLRVQRNAQHALMEEMQHMEEERVGLLFRVSEPLRIEIHFEVYSPMLRSHQFLSGYCEAYPQVMRRVCHFAMSMATLSPGDTVFNAGEIPSPPQMYIVVEGELEYRCVFSDSIQVSKGQYISEGTLWTSWAHVGTLVALGPTRLGKLDAGEFRKIVTRFHHDSFNFNPCVYANQFVKGLRGMEELSDIWPGPPL